MSDDHFNRFEKIEATEPSVLNELEDGPWGSIFEFEEILVLAKHMSAYRLKKGHTLFKQGDRLPFVCFVVKGAVSVYKEDALGDIKKLIDLRSGKTLGEMSLIDGEPRSATCKALVDTDVLILDQEGLEKLEARYPHVALALMSSLAKDISRRLRKTTGTLLNASGDADPIMF